MISQVGVPVTISGTAPSGTWTRVLIKNERGDPTFCRKLVVRCDDAANNLLISLDGGKTSVPIPKASGSLSERTFDGPITSVSVSGSGGTSAYSMVASTA
jgi:hypothetical protein